MVLFRVDRRERHRVTGSFAGVLRRGRARSFAEVASA